MSPDEIEVALQTAFDRCDALRCPLTDTQKEVLLQEVQQLMGSRPAVSDTNNPLDELTLEELQAFLQFVKLHEEQNYSWKAQLLNDWWHESDSGTVQFIRERYGLQWLNRVEPYHFNKYSFEYTPKLKVGDRIEICNALWEWVQENGPCTPEWFSCTVIRVEEINYGDRASTSCLIRFNNNAEYEIPGIYEWNSYNWRWGMSNNS
ncbi:MAG: hypothetical protein PUP93_06845 [Rhizonema sp. NSF051]|nr:hypothetical protein [Rhizonema sp. NSF051]